jgi:two-component system copper resistance phosphate regulon response regulator CusR
VRLLLLEDDRRLRAAYARRLEAAGGDVDEVGTLADAQRALGLTAFDCLVLDRLVPDGDAVSLVREIDRQPDRPPVLLISGLGDASARLDGLYIGADDYMVKPFPLEELALRVRKLVDAAPSSAGVLHLGRVRLDRHQRNVTCDGTRVHLTPTQFKLLELLGINIGSAVTTDDLYDHCWDAHACLKRTVVHPHVWKLRQLFEGHLMIESRRGVGYTLRFTT